MRRRLAPWLLAAVGAALAAALLAVAEPGRIADLVRRTSWDAVLLAFGLQAAVMVTRGVRLALLAGGRLAPARASAVVAVSQVATALLPWRLGELALLPLLRAAGLPGNLRALSLLLAQRALDLAAVLAWSVVAAAALGGSPVAAALALAALLAAGWVAVRVGEGVLRRRAAGWRRAGGWRRRSLRQVLETRRELRTAARSPWRLGGAAACSLLAWGGLWALMVTLLRGMGLPWPAGAVLLGVLGAALGSSLPINAVGSFGSMEAGWTAAMAPFALPTAEVVAAGFATHLWSVLFALLLALVAVPFLSLRRRDGSWAPGSPD